MPYPSPVPYILLQSKSSPVFPSSYLFNSTSNPHLDSHWPSHLHLCPPSPYSFWAAIQTPVLPFKLKPLLTRTSLGALRWGQMKGQRSPMMDEEAIQTHLGAASVLQSNQQGSVGDLPAFHLSAGAAQFECRNRMKIYLPVDVI